MMRRSLWTCLLAASLAAPIAGSAPAFAKPKPKKQKKGKGDKTEKGDQTTPAPAAGEGGGGDEGEMTFDKDEPAAEPAQPQPGAAGGAAAGGAAGGAGAAGAGAQPEPGGEPEPGGDVNLGEDVTAEPGAQKTELADTRVSWEDIVVVVRKPFLKVRRIELLPTWGVTVNDNIIRHFQFAGEINYYLTDVLAVGVEGDYYVKDLREPYDLVARQARRLPTVNKYNYGASLNFHYVPIYGKFALLDKHIIHWETFFTAGAGFTQSEVIPRDPAFLPFKNFLITPNVGASMRFFINKFITVHAGIRDYIFVDKFEPVGRSSTMYTSADSAKSNADSSLINNVVFQAGVSLWFPMGFEYTTFR